MTLPPLLTESIVVHLLPYVIERCGADPPTLPPMPSADEVRLALEVVQRRIPCGPTHAPLVQAVAALIVGVEDGTDSESAALAVIALVAALRAADAD